MAQYVKTKSEIPAKRLPAGACLFNYCASHVPMMGAWHIRSAGGKVNRPAAAIANGHVMSMFTDISSATALGGRGRQGFECQRNTPYSPKESLSRSPPLEKKDGLRLKLSTHHAHVSSSHKTEVTELTTTTLLVIYLMSVCTMCSDLTLTSSGIWICKKYWENRVYHRRMQCAVIYNCIAQQNVVLYNSLNIFINTCIVTPKDVKSDIK